MTDSQFGYNDFDPDIFNSFLNHLLANPSLDAIHVIDENIKYMNSEQKLKCAALCNHDEELLSILIDDVLTERINENTDIDELISFSNEHKIELDYILSKTLFSKQWQLNDNLIQKTINTKAFKYIIRSSTIDELFSYANDDRTIKQMLTTLRMANICYKKRIEKKETVDILLNNSDEYMDIFRQAHISPNILNYLLDKIMLHQNKEKIIKNLYLFNQHLNNPNEHYNIFFNHDIFDEILNDNSLFTYLNGKTLNFHHIVNESSHPVAIQKIVNKILEINHLTLDDEHDTVYSLKQTLYHSGLIEYNHDDYIHNVSHTKHLRLTLQKLLSGPEKLFYVLEKAITSKYIVYTPFDDEIRYLLESTNADIDQYSTLLKTHDIKGALIALFNMNGLINSMQCLDIPFTFENFIHYHQQIQETVELNPELDIDS